MRDNKSLSFLLLLSSFLFLLSIILLCTWGYKYYRLTEINNAKEKALKKDTAAVVAPNISRDSLLKIYKQALGRLDNKADTVWNVADTLKNNLDSNLKEFYRLRDEIANLLQTQTLNAADLDIASKKIGDLQLKIEELKYHNTDVETENKKLKAIVAQMKSRPQGVDENYQSIEKQNKKLIAKVNALAVVNTTNLTLQALTNNNQQETTIADETEKMQGFFTVKSNMNSKCEFVVVVLQPDGQVLQKSDWESGTFETKKGKKIYSCKLIFDAKKDESKQLSFSLSADKYLKGNYTMEIYHNGILIGRKV